MKKWVFYLIIFCLFGSFLFVRQTSAAGLGGRALDKGYFTNASPTDLFNNCNVMGAASDGNCLDGQAYAIPASAHTKSGFIAFIKTKLAGTTYEHVGAAFILNTMLGNNGPGGGRNPTAGGIAKWEAAINSSAVSLSIQNYSTAINTAYSPGINDDFYYSDSAGGSAQSLVFSVGASIRYVIKLDCGNPLGNLPGLPQPPPKDVPPIGNVLTQCDTNAPNTGHVSVSFSDANGDTSAQLVITYADGSTSGTITIPHSGNAYGWDIPGTKVEGNWSATLTVQDAGGNLNQVYSSTSGKCYTPVVAGVGGAVTVSCTQLSGYTYDGASPGTSTKYYVYVNPPAGTPASYASGATIPIPTAGMRGPGNANLATPMAPVAGNHGYLNQMSDLRRFNYKGDTANNTFWIYVLRTNNSIVRVATTTLGPCVPVGNVDVGPGSCKGIQGWMFDPRSPATSINYDIYINGSLSVTGPTNTPRDDVNSAYGITGTHGFNTVPTYLLPGFNAYASNTITVRAVGIDGVQYDIPNGTFTAGPCTAVACGTTTFPATMGVGQQQSFIVSPIVVPTPLNPPTDPALTVTITGPAGSGFTQTFPNEAYTVPPGSSQLTSSALTFIPTVDGTYTLTWSLSGSVNINCPDISNGNSPVTGQAGYLPYFRVEDGDLSVGAGFGTSRCSTASDVTGYTRDGSNFGAGSELAALVTGKLKGITGFATATAKDGSASTNTGQPGGLAVANTNPSQLGFNGFTNWCVPDYAAAAAGAAGVIPIDDAHPANTVNVNKDGIYSLSGHNYTLPTASVLGAPLGTNSATGKGVHLTLKITGNLLITSNVLYKAYTSVAAIPQLNVIVTGNIYIKSGVTELHGFYVAQPSSPTSTDGNIYTCTDASANPLENVAGVGTCSQKLTVYGAVAANHLYLDRTPGSVYPSGAPLGSSPTDPAEIFQFDPELWLSTLSETSTTGGTTYQSITSLPPVL